MQHIRLLPSRRGAASLRGFRRDLIAALAFGVGLSNAAIAQSPPGGTPSWGHFEVITHLYDTRRTGWNSHERILNALNVKPQSFGLLYTVAVDDQVDAQPLVVHRQKLSHQGRAYDVVYLATENNTVYVIDSSTGQILNSRNLGTPVPTSALPGQCNNNGPNVGITSTPVIDRVSQAMYLVTYTMEGGAPVYRLHALALDTLSDRVPSLVVTASHALTNGVTYKFDPAVTRQRAALLEANGNIYAGFASFCDLRGDVSRGWVLGWEAGTLTPLAKNQLNDELATFESNQFFLSSVWMSGAGIAADRDGNLFFVTSNSDRNTYNSPYNIQESVVKMSGDLKHILGLFTPSTQNALDMKDWELGAGGVLLVPPQPALPLKYLATAAGKDGHMYLLNRGSFAGASSPRKCVGTFATGACFCAESYFLGADGVGRIVTGGGSQIVVWKFQTATGNRVTLTPESTTVPLYPRIPALAAPGVFTTVSSDGTQQGTAVIWAVARPWHAHTAPILTFYAFNAANGATLYSAQAGGWPSIGAYANIVPVVANGHVYVAGYKQLAVFGLGGQQPGDRLAQAPPPAVADKGNQLSGWVKAVDGPLLTLWTRSAVKMVDASHARQAHLSVPIFVGGPVFVRGTYDAKGLLHAEAILRAKDLPDLWQPDR
jgi:hypothetical protein